MLRMFHETYKEMYRSKWEQMPLSCIKILILCDQGSSEPVQRKVPPCVWRSAFVLPLLLEHAVHSVMDLSGTGLCSGPLKHHMCAASCLCSLHCCVCAPRAGEPLAQQSGVWDPAPRHFNCLASHAKRVSFRSLEGLLRDPASPLASSSTHKGSSVSLISHGIFVACLLKFEMCDLN